jgi:outer membrane receptor protein involved in Fe transport
MIWKVLTLLILLPQILVAQIIKGRVLDKDNKQAVGFANVFLYKAGDETKAVGGATTEEDGTFIIRNVSDGAYLLKIQTVGYKNIAKSIEVAGNEVNLGDLVMMGETETIEKVEVLAQKDLVKTDIGTRSYNVSQDLINKGGTALDVMQNIPSVQVDENNNVSLRGSSNLTILINGKQSGLMGGNPQAIFQRIPASSIERIEVINNPSAKYDAQASGGIINIVLKKQSDDGFGGNIGFNAGNFDRYNSSVDFNYKEGKWNVYGSLNGNQDTRLSEATVFRKSFVSGTTPIIDQRRSISRSGQNFTSSLGLEFAPNQKDAFSVEINLGGGRNNSNETLNNFNKNADNSIINNFIRLSGDNANSFNQNYALGYTRKFAKPRQELKIAASLAKSEDFTKLNSTQTEDIRQRTSEDNGNQMILLQADYTHPLKKDWRIETGYKSIFRKVSNDFVLEDVLNDVWVNNNNFSNDFRFDEKVYGGYGILFGRYKNLEFEAGVRVEQTFTTSELINTNQTFKNDYLNAFPNGAISYRLPKEQQIKATYGRRINRPGFRQLNPFANFSNPLTLRSGNPFLRPEYTNSYELGYLKDWKQASFTSSLFYRATSNVIQPFIRQIAGDTTLFAPENIATAENYGLEMIGSYRVGKWLTLNGDFSFFRTVVNARNVDDQALNDVYSWNTRINAIFNLPKNFRIQAMAFYRAPVATAQGTRKDMFMNSIGVSKTVLKNRGTFNLRISDVAKSLRFGGTVNTPNLFNDFTFRGNTRTYMAGFSYRFGGEVKAKKNRSRRDMQGGDFDGGDF